MKTPIEKLIESLQSKHDGFIGVQGHEARQNFKDGLAWAISSAETALCFEKQEIEIAYNNGEKGGILNSSWDGKEYFEKRYGCGLLAVAPLTSNTNSH